jgi:chitinase
MHRTPSWFNGPRWRLVAALPMLAAAACGGDDSADCEAMSRCGAPTGGGGSDAGIAAAGGGMSGAGGGSSGGSAGGGAAGGSAETGGSAGTRDASSGDGGAATGGSSGTGGASTPDASGPLPRRVVGYVATWIGGLGDWVDFTQVTHLNIAFANPAGGNEPSLPFGDDQIAGVVKKAHAAGSHVLISIGGGGDGASEGVATHYTAGNVAGFVDGIAGYLDAHDLDGVDVDVEGDVVGNGDYAPFVEKLRAKLHPKGKLVTSALAPWFLDPISDAALAQFDFINVMSYDDCDNTMASCEHATYQLAVSDLSAFTKRGVPAAKLVLGVPFYGYCWGACPDGGYLPYDAILQRYPDAWQKDWIDQGGSKISYNGQPTIKKKAELAKGYGGMMFWEASEDTAGDHSLLKTILDNL